MYETRDIGMDEWKGIIKRNAQPYPDDDEQLQDDEEPPRAPHNHAGGAWSPREDRGDSNEMRSEMRPPRIRTDSFVRRPSNERGTTTGEARGIQRARMKLENENCCRKEGMSREKARQPKYHSPARLSVGSESQRDRRHLRIHMKKCRTRSMLHKTRRARAESPDGTPVQRVERVQKGWGAVRTFTGKRRTATHDLHHTCKRPLRIASGTEACERTPKIPSLY
ncbi:hypothetical protein DFH08DRAFT_806271 [Mycena albidolilacea]|uniref:Uncharacterized protein n=1 Tax=Mycena albidolilacea TaxID=1033008 RepID=A0AAD7A8W0_9AGAR|nr:hypothetical protein DFH08DRAFT_806271 [Mycena albidolilacea]